MQLLMLVGDVQVITGRKRRCRVVVVDMGTIDGGGDQGSRGMFLVANVRPRDVEKFLHQFCAAASDDHDFHRAEDLDAFLNLGEKRVRVAVARDLVVLLGLTAVSVREDGV